MVYKPVLRSQILDALVHLRELYRQIEPSSGRELLAYERREAATRDLLSNLPRVSEHPTLRTLFEIADIFQLTLGGAHRLFGYDLDRIREYDLRLNSGRTHVIESYPFERDLRIDLPSRFEAREAFASNALLRDLVMQWQTDVPIRALDEEGWHQQETFYVHVGTEDSLGSSIPPGALALVTPVDEDERIRPNPRGIYLLQLGTGYRCSHCVATRPFPFRVIMSPCFFGSRFPANSKAPSDTIITIERAIVSTFTHAAQPLKALDAPEPIFTTLTMMGAKGRQMELPRYGPDSGYLSPAFDRDTIIGPDVSIQNWEESSPYPSTLLPLVNSLWQAAGLQQAPYIRSDGVWRH